MIWLQTVLGYPVAEFTALITAIGLLVTAITGFITLIVSIRNGRRLQITHDLVNSQSTALLELTRTTSHAEGVAEGEAHTAPQ
jgi:hypothetical protein